MNEFCNLKRGLNHLVCNKLLAFGYSKLHFFRASGRVDCIVVSSCRLLFLQRQRRSSSPALSIGMMADEMNHHQTDLRRSNSTGSDDEHLSKRPQQRNAWPNNNKSPVSPRGPMKCEYCALKLVPTCLLPQGDSQNVKWFTQCG